MKKKLNQTFTAFTLRNLMSEIESVKEEDYLEEDRLDVGRWPVIVTGTVVVIIFLLAIFGIIPVPLF